ncbi:hypothetical protein ACTXIV_02850 [Psychrobacter celer]|uniref:hypothetical protein n=1 Tax=Psychrobacter celer TaxID=306572 RepID=UPI003FD0F675
MNNTNYCANYIEDNKNIPQRQPFIDFAHTSVKFRLPDFGVIMSVGNIDSKGSAGFADIPETFSKYITIMKLPYERVALEFPYDGSKMIVMAANHPDGTIRFTYSFKATKDGLEQWFDTRVGVKITPTFKVYTSNTQNDQLTNEENHLIYYITYVILGFITALECSNVVENDQMAVPKLNKSRIKKGKEPLFDYKVLTLDTKSQAAKSKSGSNKERTHTKREHLRRGHVRHYEHKTIWINAHMVGDKTKGSISKDYKVI